MKVNHGGMAFPSGEAYRVTDLVGNVSHHSKGPLHGGMTLRQWYAGQALAGQLANPEFTAIPVLIAEWCFKYADAMIAFEQQEIENGKALERQATVGPAPHADPA